MKLRTLLSLLVLTVPMVASPAQQDLRLSAGAVVFASREDLLRILKSIRNEPVAQASVEGALLVAYEGKDGRAHMLKWSDLSCVPPARPEVNQPMEPVR